MSFLKHRNIFFIILVMVTSFTLVALSGGCRGNRPKRLPTVNPANISLTVTGILAQLQITVVTNTMIPVDAAQLKSLFRSRAAGIRSHATMAETTPAVPYPISMAKSSYISGTGVRIEITLSDYVAITDKPETHPELSWTAGRIERENDRGFERVGLYNSHFYYEEYNQETHMGQIKLLLGLRFLVEIDGSNISDRSLRIVLRELDIQRLNRLVTASQNAPVESSR